MSARSSAPPSARAARDAGQPGSCPGLLVELSSTGSAEITPTVGFSGCRAGESLATSYSRNSSLSGWKNAMTSRRGSSSCRRERSTASRCARPAARPAGELRGTVFVSRRLGVDAVSLTFALSARPFLQQLAHALRIGAQLRRLGARFLREEKSRGDGSWSELTMRCVPGAIEIQLALGEIDARAAQQNGMRMVTTMKSTARATSAPATKVLRRSQVRVVISSAFFSRARSRLPSQTAITVAKLQQVANVDHALGIEPKCVRTTRATASITVAAPALDRVQHHRETRQQNRKQTVTLRMNAITVARHCREARADASNRPRRAGTDEGEIAPLSGSPR